jgi:hypothetical protein
VEAVDSKVTTMANGGIKNSSTVHQGLARCAITWSSSEKKKGASGSLETMNRWKWRRQSCSRRDREKLKYLVLTGCQGRWSTKEKEDAGAHSFWTLGGSGDRRDSDNGGRRELSGWPDRVKRNRTIARTRCWASRNTVRESGGAGRHTKQDLGAGKTSRACGIGDLASHVLAIDAE